jgi:putative nucleotidyltransferase with HDIG domain
MKKRMNELPDPVLDLLLFSIFLCDLQTGLHSYRAANIALALAKQLGMSKEEEEIIFIGSLLHDLGKTRIPRHLLNKAGPLSDQEWQTIRRHPEIGFHMLRGVLYLRPYADIPYCHHEQWDGGGYPRGLKGEAIPLPARLFALVDAWDALQSDRPYRKAWDEEKTVQFIQEQSGKRFDPDLVSILLPELVKPNEKNLALSKMLSLDATQVTDQRHLIDLSPYPRE